jgi:GDP-L-fucose synthase
MNSNIITAAHKHKVDKLICFLSTCIFPDNVEYPLREDKIHLGPPHHSNYGYAYAKRMVDVQVKAFNEQYGTKYFTVIPTNIYGPRDNYNINNGHVIPSLIHKVYKAKQENTDLIVWGTGKPLREFIFSKDVARIVEILADTYEDTKPVIISTSQEVSIREVVTTICDILDFKNKIIFDTSKPDGQYRKPSDNEYLKSIIGDFNFTPLEVGLQETISYFVNNYNTVRR